MTKDNCFYLGLITRPNGIKGAVSIYLDVDSPNEYAKMESMFVEINKTLVPFFIEYLQIRNRGQAVAKLEGVTTEAEAQQMVNMELWLPLTALPKLSGNKFYYHEVANFTVEDKTLGKIGFVKTVLDYSSNAILQLDFNGREILIPIRDEFISSVDREAKILFVNTPPGLVDIYLTDNHSQAEEA